MPQVPPSGKAGPEGLTKTGGRIGVDARKDGIVSGLRLLTYRRTWRLLMIPRATADKELHRAYAGEARHDKGKADEDGEVNPGRVDELGEGDASEDENADDEPRLAVDGLDRFIHSAKERPLCGRRIQAASSVPHRPASSASRTIRRAR